MRRDPYFWGLPTPQPCRAQPHKLRCWAADGCLDRDGMVWDRRADYAWLMTRRPVDSSGLGFSRLSTRNRHSFMRPPSRLSSAVTSATPPANLPTKETFTARLIRSEIRSAAPPADVTSCHKPRDH